MPDAQETCAVELGEQTTTAAAGWYRQRRHAEHAIAPFKSESKLKPSLSHRGDVNSRRRKESNKKVLSWPGREGSK
jgi:hypothetical protein